MQRLRSLVARIWRCRGVVRAQEQTEPWSRRLTVDRILNCPQPRCPDRLPLDRRPHLVRGCRRCSGLVQVSSIVESGGQTSASGDQGSSSSVPVSSAIRARGLRNCTAAHTWPAPAPALGQRDPGRVRPAAGRARRRACRSARPGADEMPSPQR